MFVFFARIVREIEIQENMFKNLLFPLSSIRFSRNSKDTRKNKSHDAARNDVHQKFNSYSVTVGTLRGRETTRPCSFRGRTSRVIVLAITLRKSTFCPALTNFRQTRFPGFRKYLHGSRRRDAYPATPSPRRPRKSATAKNFARLWFFFPTSTNLRREKSSAAPRLSDDSAWKFVCSKNHGTLRAFYEFPGNFVAFLRLFNSKESEKVPWLSNLDYIISNEIRKNLQPEQKLAAVD